MLKARAYQLRLPADWPPASITVNGAPVQHAHAANPKSGWSFEGNTLTTVIPVASTPTSVKVVFEIRRAAGLTAKRAEIDGFPGRIARLRAAYSAMRSLSPVADAQDPLIHAMETGDRLTYHPEKAVEEIAAFHANLPAARSSVEDAGKGFEQRIDETIAWMRKEEWRPAGIDWAAERRKRIDALARAISLVTDAAR